MLTSPVATRNGSSCLLHGLVSECQGITGLRDALLEQLTLLAAAEMCKWESHRQHHGVQEKNSAVLCVVAEARCILHVRMRLMTSLWGV